MAESEIVDSKITAIITTSPIPSNPSTEKIDIVVKSIRDRLPGSQIVIMADGVRKEQEDMRDDYEEFLDRLTHDSNTDIYRSQLHKHQAQLTREAMDHVRTPLILFVEHDLPLCGDIPFDQLGLAILEDQADLIRLMHEAQILEPHKYLMLGEFKFKDLILTKTVQWSQRPHLARADFYRDILTKYFSENNNTFIEDRMYGIVYGNYEIKGEQAWSDFRLTLYTPEGDMKRLDNLDGRENGEKYDDRLVY